MPVVCGQERGSGVGELSPAGRVFEAVEGFPGLRGASAGEGASAPGPGSGSHSPAATAARPFSTLRAI